MGVTPGKKSPKKTPKLKSPAEPEPMETAVISPEKKTAKSPSNGLEKKSGSTKKKSLKRKLDDVDYEENTEDVKNSEAVIIEEDLNDSQKESGKKQKKKKHRVEEENKSTDSAKKKTGISSDDGKEDEEGKYIPSECKLFVTSIGLEGMTKNDLKDYFKSLGYGLVLTIKQSKSRHAFIGFATVKEASKARESLDKTDCRGFPLSVDSKDLMLSALHLFKNKSSQLINTEGTADCSLYVSPITPAQTKQKLMDSFIGVVNVFRKGPTRNWVRLICANSTIAKELHRSHQGKVVEGSALKVETAEEFRKRITEEEAAKVIEFRKQKQREQKMEKKQKEAKTKEKKSKAEPKESNDESDSEGGEDDDVRVVNDDADSDEEEVAPKAKKVKESAPKSKKAKEAAPKSKKAKVAGKR